jgi:dihydropteroate synthase type 2
LDPCTPLFFGILNITEDSFSDGGRFLEPEAAIAQARHLSAEGAHVIDIGAASSRPNAKPVPAATEIARMTPVLAALHRLGLTVSVDSFAPEVQRWALGQDIAYLNDVRGFPDSALYPALAASPVKLIVMHSLEGQGPATRASLPADQIIGRIESFFDARLAALAAAGIARERVILDPGMGFFLGRETEASLTVLREIPRLKACFGLPVLISVSRKSFLRKLSGADPAGLGPASLAAELFALARGAAMIRTHEPGALAKASAVWRALDPAPAGDNTLTPADN